MPNASVARGLIVVGGPEGKAKVAAEVGKACREVGFLVVSGHGVLEDLVRATCDTSKAFFAAPLGLDELRIYTKEKLW